MKRLLRGVIDFGGISPEGLKSNFLKLRESGIEWPQPADQRIYRFIFDFFAAEVQLPSSRVLYEHFDRVGDIEVLERIKDAKEAAAYEGANYGFVLKTLLDDQKRLAYLGILKIAQDAATKGHKEQQGSKERVYKGLEDATLLLQRVNPLLREPGEEPEDVETAERIEVDTQEYLQAKAGKRETVYCGLKPIDDATKGLHRKEIWIHAAYTGELKSTFATNWAYFAATQFHTHVVYVNLEMSEQQVRTGTYVLHTTHPRWPEDHPEVSYLGVRDGQLSAEAERFYEEVKFEFAANEEHCRHRIWTPAKSVGVAEIEAHLRELDQEMPIGLVIIDHAELVVPSSFDRNHGVRINSVYQDLRALARGWKGGLGLPILVLHQINRDGKDKAAKAGGRYSSASALSWAHEAERTASVITTSYLDNDLRRAGQVRIQNLKNRDRALFADLTLRIDWATKSLSHDAGEDLLDGIPEDLDDVDVADL